MHHDEIGHHPRPAAWPRRSALRMLFAAAATAGVAAPLALGCDDLPTCGDGSEPDQLKCEGAQGGDGGGGGPPSCVPGPDTGAVPADCGVFVSSSLGSDSGSGSPSAPRKTLASAVALAVQRGEPIYACAEDFLVSETVELPAGTVLYGGLDCADGWRVSGGAELTAVRASPSGVIPVRLKAGSGATELHRFRIVAEAGGAPGASSIAVLVEDVRATLADSELVAGDGADGEKGSTPGMGAAQNGASGGAGSAACGAPLVSGGVGGVTGCDDGQTAGGDGGTGAEMSGGAGKNGTPAAAQSGIGGIGEVFNPCQVGGGGKAGEAGAAGANAVGAGAINENGYAGVTGGDATAGVRGKGGGGGGGSKGGTDSGKCADANNGGASGGGGGAGGCGGAGGRGGGPGGSSIAIVSLASTEATRLLLKNVTLSVGRGGSGGEGGDGQEGGAGGVGGVGGSVPMGAGALSAGCKGGDGGKGGVGGKGGAGLPGYAVGVAFTGEAPAKVDVVLDPSSPAGSVEQRQFN